MVSTWANKTEIANLINGLFNVTVTGITTSNGGARSVRFKQKLGNTAHFKKTTVRLLKGQTISDFALPIEKTTESPDKSERSSSTSNSNETREPVVLKTESKITVRSKSKKDT